MPQKNWIKNFLCHKPGDDSVKEAADTASNVGSAADAVKPAVALGAAAAGLSRGLDSPLGTSAFGQQLAGGLAKLGTYGKFAAGFGLGVDAIKGDWQSLTYDLADYFIYSKVSEIGAAGAEETLGGSVALAGATLAAYAANGGSRGVVQSVFCQ